MAENRSITSGPKDFSEGTFIINNSSSDLDHVNSPSDCIVSQLQISNYQMDEAAIKDRTGNHKGCPYNCLFMASSKYLW
jgi:hypothetical protein